MIFEGLLPDTGPTSPGLLLGRQVHPFGTAAESLTQPTGQARGAILGCEDFLVVAVVHFLSGVRLFATPWTAARQAPLSMEFSRQEYWSGSPFPSPGHLPDPGVKLRLLHWQVDSLPPSHQGSPCTGVLFNSGVSRIPFNEAKTKARLTPRAGL